MSDDTILETISQSKRGRPPVMSKEVEDEIKKSFPEIRTRRGRQNKFHAIYALTILREGFEYIVNTKAVTAGTQDLPFTLLTELGRLDDSDIIREIAGIICKEQLTPKEAVIRIKRMRRHLKTGQFAPVGTITELSEIISKTIQDYKQARQDVTPQMVKSALANYLEGVYLND